MGQVYCVFTSCLAAWLRSMLVMADDVKAFHQSISGFPPAFLDRRMEALFVRAHSRRVTLYYIALSSFWVFYMIVALGGFLVKPEPNRLLWWLPCIVGTPTTVAFMIIYTALALRTRASVRGRERPPAEAGNEGSSDPEDCPHEHAHEDKAGPARQTSLDTQVCQRRWTVVRDVVVGIAITAVSGICR